MNETARAGDLIALYGSLLRGLDSMTELGIGEQLRFVGPCVLEGQLFDLGPYPGLRPGTGLVLGEIYALLDLEALTTLDQFEGYIPDRSAESLYLREQVRLIEPTQTRAWVYVYNGLPEIEQRVASGDWRAHLAARVVSGAVTGAPARTG